MNFKNSRFLFGFILAAGFQLAFACELQFKIDSDFSVYALKDIPGFIKQKVRPSIENTNDESKRYDIIVSNVCSSQEREKSASARLTIQKNLLYIKSLNGIPLCVEYSTPNGMRCEKGKYNYVDYKGGAEITIDEHKIVESLKAVANISSIQELEKAYTDSTNEKVIHDAIRVFAFLFAESARFDYVLDDITCALSSDSSVSFMDYWTLVHNWGTITSRVEKYNKSLKPSPTYQGAGTLFVPVTRAMVPFFNQSLKDYPPKPEDLTADGKYHDVPIHEPICAIDQIVVYSGAKRKGSEPYPSEASKLPVEEKQLITKSGNTYRYFDTGDAGRQAETRDVRIQKSLALDATYKATEAVIDPKDIFEVSRRSRGVAKTSVVRSKLEFFPTITELLNTLPLDKDMATLEIDKDTPRVEQEMRYVGACGWIVASARESDADYHLILSNGSRKFMNVEISGIPDRANKKDRELLIKARNEFETFVEESGRSTGSYKGWKDPVPVYIEGSLFWDIEHGPGQVGPVGARPQTAWEIHPVANIEFESKRCR